jgi:transposase
MPKPHREYPPEFRRQLIEVARAGKSPEALTKEFEPLGAWPAKSSSRVVAGRKGPLRSQRLGNVPGLYRGAREHASWRDSGRNLGGRGAGRAAGRHKAHQRA